MELTNNEKVLRITGLMYALVFTVTVMAFIFFPGLLFRIINDISIALFPSLYPAVDSGKFWLSMTVSMMVTITVLSFMIYRDVQKNYTMAIPLVAAKFTSSFFGLMFFIIGSVEPSTGWNTLANCIIAITDFPLGLFMLILYLRVKYERGTD